MDIFTVNPELSHLPRVMQSRGQIISWCVNGMVQLLGGLVAG